MAGPRCFAASGFDSFTNVTQASNGDLKEPGEEATMTRIRRFFWTVLDRIMLDRGDVGHGFGCTCVPCEVERLDRGAR